MKPPQPDAHSTAFAHRSIQMPAVGHALELVLPGIFECETGANDEVFHRRRDEHFGRTAERRDPCSDVDGDALHLRAHELYLSRVETDPNLQSDRPERVDDGLGAPD